MKRQLFIILLLGTSVCLVWGQNNPKEYYKYINEAELACLQMSDENDLGQKAARCYEKAVKEGTYDARSYMDFYDECLNWRCQADTGCDTRYGLGFNSNIVIGNTLFIYPTGDVAEINAHRKELGVSETYADYEKKLQAAFFHGAGFVPRLNIGDFGDPEEDAAAAAEARAEIDSGKYKGRYIIKQ